MNSQTNGNTEAAILSRLLEPERSNLQPEAAKYLLSIDFSPSDLNRMDELAQQAQAGALSDKETVELESYRHVGHLLALMQSKARISLKDLRHSPRNA